MRQLIPLIVLFIYVECMAQDTFDKVLWAEIDSLNFKMEMSEFDDIFFHVFDKRMNKIKIDSILGNGNLHFKHEINVPLKLDKVDEYTLKTSLKNFRDYIKFLDCELTINYRGNLKKIVFVNK
ncbi:MAG: hypothetical protein SFY32_05720 [Bacteroidota bacterium]|nr:hypothetical protein [Bacteroidota bacterium]